MSVKPRKKFRMSELRQREYLRPDEFSFLTGMPRRSLADVLGTVIPYSKIGHAVYIHREKALAAMAALERGATKS